MADEIIQPKKEITYAQRFQAAYQLVLKTQPKWKQTEIKDPASSDRHTKAFLEDVAAFAENDNNIGVLTDEIYPPIKNELKVENAS